MGMSPTQNLGFASGRARQKIAEIRSLKVVNLTIAGLSPQEIAQRLGVSVRTIYVDIANRADEFSALQPLLEDSPIDAQDLHLRLSQMFDADIADIIDETTNCYKPIHKWPKIWRQMLTGSEIKELFEHSKDGTGASWDKIGEVVKIRFVDQIKVLELAMKHRAIDAMAKTEGDTNILVVTADTARKVVGARKRLEKIIDVKAEGE